ncbi:uncharacterized protein LOC143275616 [Babylonia areolata]|uniref:uncharacterized protein LOC143275616 n=1 Tax=Babylonia areolata TaxID=304850 RepID=UPI003FCF1486
MASLGEGESSAVTSDYSVRQERAHHASFSCQSQAEVACERQTPPCQGHVTVIDSDLLQRWRQTGIDQDLSSDSQIADFLLSRYEESRTKASGASHLCSCCQTPLTLVCLTCNPAQNKYEENALPSTACDDSGSDIHHWEHDGDSDVTSAVRQSDGSLLLAEPICAHDCTSQESKGSSTIASFSSFTKDCRMFKQQPGGIFSVSQNTDEKTSDGRLAQRFDIVLENSVKSLGKKGLLSSVETGKQKVSESKNHNSAALPKKTAGKKRKKVSAIRTREKVESHLQDNQTVEEELVIKKRKGRPRIESLPKMSEDGETEGKVYKCSVCSMAFKDRSVFHDHECRHRKDRKPHKCEHCPAAFRSRGNLIAHSRKHTGERPFSCETCGKSFARSTTLHQHMRIHTDDRPYKCEECGEAFRQRGMVIVHRRKVHTYERPFSCSVCKASFVVKGHLQVHMQSHTGSRPYLCEKCGASFRQKGILETHRMIHTGLRPFSCDICRKSFFRQVDLRSHKKTHFNIRNVICTVCGAAFGSNSTLKRHMQKHTGFRPFRCSECEKNFASNSELKVHLRTHSGDKPYICDVCKRGFQTMGNMKKHRNNRHKHAPPYVSKPDAGDQTEGDQSHRWGIPASPKTDPFPTDCLETDVLQHEQNISSLSTL